MKTIILLVFITACSVLPQDYPFSEEDAASGFGISFNGSLKFENSITLSRSSESSKMDAVPSYAAGLEYILLRDGDDKKAGAGFEYQFKNSVYGVDGSYQNIPVYLFYDMSLIRVKYIALPNLHLQIGYNFLNLNDGFPVTGAGSKGGLFYAAGLSAKIVNHVYARLLYSSSQGTVVSDGEDYLFSSNKISLTLSLQ